MGKDNRVIIVLAREQNGSFSVSLDAGEESEQGYEYVGGLSEGYEFDPTQAAKDAGWLVERYFNDLFVKDDLSGWRWITTPTGSKVDVRS